MSDQFRRGCVDRRTSPPGRANEEPPNYCKWTLSAYRRVPIIRSLPPKALGVIILLVFVNIAVWIAVGVVSHYFEGLAGTAILAWTLGLRHALDADHISAIDLMTRRLVAANQRPVTVGTFFSLGHSTIVIITCIVVAATAASVSDRFDGFSEVGGIIGSAVSAAFLIILGLANGYILMLLLRQLSKAIDAHRSAVHTESGNPNLEFRIESGGLFFRLFKKLFKLIDRPWKMYPLGILFGMGFDTSSQVALLGISTVQSMGGRSFWLILIYPLLFTAGMCLVDTTDGALMLSLYTTGVDWESANLKASDREQHTAPEQPLAIETLGRGTQNRECARNDRINDRDSAVPSGYANSSDENSPRPDVLTLLYYNVILTVLTVIVAVVIGVIQVLGLVDSVSSPSGKFWDGLRAVQDRYDIVGGVICGTFVVVAVVSVLARKRWRRWVLDRQQSSEQPVP